jgi:hypothetical protein
MTKLKKFKETAPSWMKLSLIDVLEMIDPSNTNKFLPMLTNIVDSKIELVIGKKTL